MALLSAQLLVVPFDEFWLSLRNRFDFVVTVLLFATAIVWVWPTVRRPCGIDGLRLIELGRARRCTCRATRCTA